MLYLIVSILGIITLILRRCIVKGELGGKTTGRTISALWFAGLWFFYIIMSALA